MAKSKKAIKKSVKKVTKKSPKKAVKKSAKKPVKKLVKKVAKKAVKKSVKKPVKKSPAKSKKSVVKKVAAAPAAPVRSLLSPAELGEGETRNVIAAVKDAILRSTEEHPFYESTDSKETVVVSRDIEFVDVGRGVFMIPRGVTISVIRGDMGATWSIQRHTD